MAEVSLRFPLKKETRIRVLSLRDPAACSGTSVAALSKLKTSAKREWSLDGIALLVCDETVCSSASWSVSGAR